MVWATDDAITLTGGLGVMGVKTSTAKRSSAAKRGWATRRAKSQETRVQELSAWFSDFTKQMRVFGSYDAARSGNDLDRYWQNADAYDADSANRREVREKLVQRSRYEMANNGISDGVGQTYATDLIGTGPQLRMQTNSNGFNQLVEREFYLWTKAIQFRRKLWCKAHAKHTDGESFGIQRINPKVNHRVKLDITLHETEQCQTPFPPIGDPTYIDGIKFDEFGNVVWFNFLRHHPGKTNNLRIDPQPMRVEANRVLHWYKLRRPGQHRGVPECSSTLNLGAAFRRAAR